LATDEIHILPTNTTPEIFLSVKGTIRIKGRAIDESRSKVPDQITEWLDSYIVNPADVTRVTIALEFLNSFNTIILTSTLKKISQILQKGKQLQIKWYYDEDDLDIFERGEYISATINVPIEFIVTNNITGCI